MSARWRHTKTLPYLQWLRRNSPAQVISPSNVCSEIRSVSSNVFFELSFASVNCLRFTEWIALKNKMWSIYYPYPTGEHHAILIKVYYNCRHSNLNYAMFARGPSIEDDIPWGNEIADWRTSPNIEPRLEEGNHDSLSIICKSFIRGNHISEDDGF